MANQTFIAGDLGASSGRLLAGLFDGQRIRVEEIHRFDNHAVAWANSLHWNVLGLWSEIVSGLRKAAENYEDIRSIGVDTWGVDYALLGRNDVLLGNPHSYRDQRTAGVMDKLFERVSRVEIFRHTGIQFMPINTIYQLVSMRWADSPILEMAETLLLMPDLFHWLLTGEKGVEFTNATTTQLFDPSSGDWARELIRKLDLPDTIFGPIVHAGATLGPLRASVAQATGLVDVQVVAPGTHDTASAVVGVPASSSGGSPDWCYISSGTWSLLGAEIARPVINEQSLKYNFTNEGGIGGTIRLLKNIGGLWLVQECRRVWAEQGRDRDWSALTEEAAAAKPWAAFVDPDDPGFLSPPDMPEAIRAFCRRTGQQPPETDGAVIRAALEGLAFKYRRVLGMLEELTSTRFETIHVVGGGANNQQLCQMTADACGRRVVAGPVEATAIGNLLVQAIAAGELADVAQAREIIRNSFALREYTPQDTAAWDEAYGRFTATALGES